MAEAIRRSGRTRKQNPRYVADPIGDDDLDNVIVNVASSDSGESEFEENDDEENQDLDADEDLDEGIDEEESSTASEDETITAEAQENYRSRKDTTASKAISFDVPFSQNETPRKTTNRLKRSRPIKTQTDAQRSRGFLFNSSIKNRHIAVYEIGGNDDVFVEMLRREQDKYISTLTMPYREHSDLGRSGLAYPEIYSESIRAAEKQDFLLWYEENHGWKTMAKVQATSPCAAKDRTIYIDADLPPQEILLGPYNGQHHFTLDSLSSISVSHAWQTAISAAQDSNDYDSNASDRPAWIVNAGSRILSMDWAPNQDGMFQYLAVSVEGNRPTNISATALEPVDPYEASVQIWAFPTKPSGEKKMLDMDEEPKLVHVICANWGSIRRLSWCPAAVSIPQNTSSIGMLGVVSTDGFVRVLDICVSEDIYGCGNGYVAIWDVGRYLSARSTSAMDLLSAIPTWYHPLHTTYVASIIAHQPYPCQYIITNAVDGRVRLVSIHNPHADTAYGARARQLVPPVCISPHIFGFYEIDDAEGVRARSIRHIPFSRSAGKASAQVVCIDAGRAHPCLLFGGSDGSVVITNPLPRIFLRRHTNNKIESWQQTWFKHEFVPAARTQPTGYAAALQLDSEPHSYIHPRKGVTRFLESFQADKISTTRNTQSTKDSNAGEGEVAQNLAVSENSLLGAIDDAGQSSVGNEEIQITIYEEEQAVTCLSWNANISAGGWAAAGMANGLLRIEDLAI